MPTDHIIALLIAERDKLNAAIEALQGTPQMNPPAIEIGGTSWAAPKNAMSVLLPVGNGCRSKEALGGDQGCEVVAAA
jgi:hypothetical protein